MTPPRCPPWLLVIALVAIPAPAIAQNAQGQAEARTLFDEGARLYEAGDYTNACPKLEASFHLYAGIGTRGKLAECYEKIGRTASAWAMYEQVASLAGKAGDAVRQQVARERAAALLPRLARLTVTVAPASDVPGLSVKRDGEPVERGAMGSPIPVDPGSIAFEVGAPGRATRRVVVRVTPGEQAKFEVPPLEVGATIPAADVPSSPAGPSPATEPPSGVEATPDRPWQRPTALVVAGAGVVAAGVGVALALTAKSSYDHAFSSGHCDHAALTCDGDGQSETSGARTRANVGGVVLGVGAALVVGGGVLFFTAPSSRPAAGFHVAPVLGPGVAALSVGGGF